MAHTISCDVAFRAVMELHCFFEGEDFKAALPNEHRCWMM